MTPVPVYSVAEVRALLRSGQRAVALCTGALRGCGSQSVHLRKCGACNAAAYCWPVCQVTSSRKEGGHRQECSQQAKVYKQFTKGGLHKCCRYRG